MTLGLIFNIIRGVYGAEGVLGVRGAEEACVYKSRSIDRKLDRGVESRFEVNSLR